MVQLLMPVIEVLRYATKQHTNVFCGCCFSFSFFVLRLEAWLSKDCYVRTESLLCDSIVFFFPRQPTLGLMLVVDKKLDKLESLTLVSHPRIVAIALVCYGVDQEDTMT